MMRLLKDLKKCGNLLFEKGLVWGSSGNISARGELDTFIITGAGSNLGSLHDKDLVFCRIDQDVCEGTSSPSMEVTLHRRIYQSCEGAAAIIHSQPFYSTLVACSDMPVRVDILPETMAYLGKVARVPYHHAGSRELAEATAAEACASQVLLLDNHGVVCWASSLGEALLKTEALEFLCRMFVVSSGGGICLNYLGDAVMGDFARQLWRSGKSA